MHLQSQDRRENAAWRYCSLCSYAMILRYDNTLSICKLLRTQLLCSYATTPYAPPMPLLCHVRYRHIPSPALTYTLPMPCPVLRHRPRCPCLAPSLISGCEIFVIDFWGVVETQVDEDERAAEAAGGGGRGQARGAAVLLVAVGRGVLAWLRIVVYHGVFVGTDVGAYAVVRKAAKSNAGKHTIWVP
eukprot:2335945-Rhodomonas_salina.1